MDVQYRSRIAVMAGVLFLVVFTAGIGQPLKLVSCDMDTFVHSDTEMLYVTLHFNAALDISAFVIEGEEQLGIKANRFFMISNKTYSLEKNNHVLELVFPIQFSHFIRVFIPHLTSITGNELEAPLFLMLNVAENTVRIEQYNFDKFAFEPAGTSGNL